jgi:hypothetical protein
MSLTRGLDRVPRYTFFVLLGLLILLGSAATIVARTDAKTALKADGSAPIEYETAALLNPEDVTQNDLFQYYVPFDDRDLRNLFDASDRCQPSPSTPPTWVGDFLASNVSVTATSDGTTIYYDHWEDGYDVDPLSPGPTTEVRILNAGDVWFITEDIDVSTTPWGSIFFHDGRDRLTVYGTEVSLVRSVAPGSDSDIGARLAGAWEVAPTSSWGQAYVIPAGEDWGSGSDFEFTAATITAWITGTQLFYNGAPVATLPAGGVYFVNGVGDGTGLSSGDSFTATQPIQVHSYSSICDTGGEFWSGNGYALMPVEQWRNEYWSPVPNRTSCSVASTDIFVYNNGGGDIGLSVDDGVL